MSAHAHAHHADPAGGSFVIRAAVGDRVIAPPPPRASAVVDPRIGDLGPALLALEDGTRLPGRRVRGAGRRRRRPRRQHQPDRLPGGLHRPLVRRPGRGHDLPADRQLRPARRRRPVDAARGSAALVVANATAAVLDDARQLAALLRDDGIPAIAGVDTRALARHLRANGCLRGIVTAPGDVDPEAARRRGPRRAALGGPGLRRRRSRRRPITEYGDGRRRRPAGRHRRPRASSRTSSARCATAARASGSCRTRLRRRTCCRRDVDGVVLSPGPGRPGAARRPGRAGAGDHRRRAAAARDLPRPPDRRAGRPAPTRAGCGSATTARTTRSRTSTSGSSR